MFIGHLLTGKSGKESMLILLDDFFPECKSLTKDTQIPRLACWTDPTGCSRGSFTTCMRMLVTRGYKIFMGLPELELLIFYWKSPHIKGPGGERQWGLILERDETKELKISILNKWAVESVEKRIGKKFAISFE